MGKGEEKYLREAPSISLGSSPNECLYNFFGGNNYSKDKDYKGSISLLTLELPNCAFVKADYFGFPCYEGDIPPSWIKKITTIKNSKLTQNFKSLIMDKGDMDMNPLEGERYSKGEYMLEYGGS